MRRRGDGERPAPPEWVLSAYSRGELIGEAQEWGRANGYGGLELMIAQNRHDRAQREAMWAAADG